MRPGVDPLPSVAPAAWRQTMVPTRPAPVRRIATPGRHGSGGGGGNETFESVVNGAGRGNR